MKRALFAVIEGGEGVGKTTQAAKLALWLKSKGLRPVVTHEPGGTPLSEKIRALLRSSTAAEMDPLTELLLMEAARREHVEKLIRPSLENGRPVVCDRFTLSSVVYQGMVGGVDLETVDKLNRLAAAGLEPDVVVVIDLDPEEAVKRLRARGAGDRRDSSDLTFHRRVAEAYREAARKRRAVLVDGSGDPEQVANRIRLVVERVLATGVFEAAGKGQ